MMKCPFCFNHDSIIIHTQKFTKVVRRIRACQQCGMAWRTFEDAPCCRNCGHSYSDVINTEKYDETVKRIRTCPVCSLSWKTFESMIDDHSVIDFNPHVIDDESLKRGRKTEYAPTAKT